MPSLPIDPPAPVLPGYRLRRLLGRGASAQVWAGEQGQTGRPVAVKLVPAGPDAERELAVLRAVRHPHVVRLIDVVTRHDVVTGHDELALVTTLLDGGTLAGVVAARGRLRPGEVVTTIAPLAQALADLHAAGVEHGDLAPGNVVFDGDGRPFLTDLGTVRVTGAPRAEVFGTPGFVDPAVLAGRPGGPASDVYGLGALCWFALVGSPVPTPMCRPALVDEAPTAPGALVAVVESALAPDPASRPAPAELAAALHAAAAAEPVWRPGLAPSDGGLTRRVGTGPPEQPHAIGPRHRKDPRRARWAVMAGAVALVLAVGGGAVVGSRPEAVAQQPRLAAATRPTAHSTSRAPAISSAAEALPVIGRLAVTRTAALSRVPPACGRAAPQPGAAGSVPGSTADRADQQVLAGLASRCLHLRGLTLLPRQARVVSPGRDRVVVDVVVQESAYDVVEASGAVVQHVAAVAGRRSRLTLVRTSGGWRVERVSSTPSARRPPASGARR
ncbi:serine/threonine-protein kinase [Angustibacter luteus]|uniref:non-specific serine/threonine protein kinase n=1 Tax=Angustibacter luteus TaxID=658456 RepID=A0ABW1JAX1_9ACTN